MKITSKSSYEMQRQHLRVEYCFELIKQHWYVDGSQLESNLLMAQILHLFSKHFNINEATARNLEQLKLLVTSPEGEVHCTLPWLTHEQTIELIDSVRQVINSLIAKSTCCEPNDHDFHEAAISIWNALAARRYVVVRSTMALDRNRRRRRTMMPRKSPKENKDSNGNNPMHPQSRTVRCF